MEVNTAGRESKHVVDKNVVSHKKCGTRWKLSLDSSGLAHNRDGDGGVNEVPNDHILLSNCKKQTEIVGARKESEGMNDDYIRSQDKLCGSRRKLSLETFDQFQKGDGNDKANLVPNFSLSPKAQEPSVTSSRSSLLKAGNHYDNQEQDSKSINDRINMISKKLTVGKKQPLGSSDACQIGDGCNEEMIVSPCKSDSNASHEASPILPVVNSIEQPDKDFIDKMENDQSDLNCKRLCSVGKKLALGFRDSSQTQKKDDKENVVPVHKTPLLHPKSPSAGSSMSKVGEFYERESEISGLDVSRRKCRIGRKLSLGPHAQLQRSNDDNKQLLSHSQKLSEDPSNALHMQQDCRCDDKQKSNYDDNIKIDEGSKRQKTDESPMSELVIVLDSEDSEDEQHVCLRSKSLLARKRIGKWRAKA